MFKCLNFCRLIQGQVTRAEVEETTFAMKRELSAIKQHDIDTHMKLEKANERVKILSDQLEDQSSKEVSKIWRRGERKRKEGQERGKWNWESSEEERR